MSPRVLPSIFFDILQQTGFSKSRKGPSFNKFLKNCAFLNLRYSADLDVPVMFSGCKDYIIIQ